MGIEMKKRLNTRIKIGKLQLKNPVMTASGTFGYGLEFEKYVDLSELGAIVVKGIAEKPVKGNKPQRLVETPCGILNAIGLQNIGADRFIKEKLPLLKKYRTPVIANIYGRNAGEYTAVATKLNDSDAAGIEINISCPNVKKGGMQFAGDRKAVRGIIRRIKKVYKKTVIVKLSPNTGNIVEIAKVCEGAGADSVSLINTLVGMAVDVERKQPFLSAIYGGLSGPAIKPVALAMVHKVSKAVRIPVIGIGGIMNYRDALEFLIAGAAAVQVGTANFRDPRSTIRIIKGVEGYMRKNRIDNINKIIKFLRY